MEPLTINPILDFFDINYQNNIHDYSNNLIITRNNDYKEYYVKSIPLVDYVKYFIGKYKKYDILKLPHKNRQCENIYEEYIQSIHNYAYVDNFFYMLSSELSKHNFPHSISVLDTFINITENCEINIVDDFEYLCDSNYFNENINKLFYFKDEQLFSMLSKLKKEPIQISNEEVQLEFDELDQILEESIESVFNACNLEDNVVDISMDLVHENKKQLSDDDDDDDDDDDNDDSSDDNSSDDDSSDDDSSDDSSDDDSSDDENMIEELVMTIKQIPCQNIILEKCKHTLDDLLEKDDIKLEELTSAMFQVIVILYVYQNVFKFTHNDLHTNNIMYIETKEEYLYYKIKDKYYKIPTYGKLYKLIDFGRSIYEYKDTRLCSDSFSPNGTAHGQYNCEPFINKNKPILEPNYSFDLCRLGCSMFDFIVEDIKDIDNYRKIPLYDMIIQWIYDDNGVNVLYKKNGDERYLDFKLYKMIAKNVNRWIPETQLEHPCFQSYIVEQCEQTIDINEIIKTKVDL